MRTRLFAWLVLLSSLLQGVSARSTQPNILLIAVDDLRAEIGCYGADHVKTPYIDQLAARGVRFERAYCQQAVCNPSRTSLMTGLRPDTIGVTGNHVHFRDKQPDVATLSQYFMNHGYHAQSIGKIYHGVFPDGASKTVWDTMGDPQSWSVPTTRFGPRYYFTEDGVRQAKQAYLEMYRPKNPRPDDWTTKLVFGPMTEAPDVPDNLHYDGKVAEAAVSALREFGNQPDRSFFLAVGFIKPHTPFVAPKKYFDLYDESNLSLAVNADLPEGAPRLAGHGSHELRRYTDQPKKGPFSEVNQRRLKHAYYACISFIDAQIGRVLDALKQQKLDDNTIVVLFSDHGWHLGEHGLWGKTTNYELDARIPLIVLAPGVTASGRRTRALTELVDIYPTLTDLAGLPIPDELEGASFVPVLKDPGRNVKSAAFSQFPRGGNADLGGKTMGYSMRTDRWRYTEWIERTSGDVVARELYDHDEDPDETLNLADKSQYAQIVTSLSRRLDKGQGWRTGRGNAGRVGIENESTNILVFQQGDGAGSHYGYRIPALAVSQNNTVLAFCERRVGLHDHAQNDIVLRRSTDGGQTWGDLRKLSVSHDGGETWSPHRFAEELMTPACMSSMIWHVKPSQGGDGLLLHSLPHTSSRRANGTIFVSRDEGQSWTRAAVIEPQGFAYSCLASLPGGDVGCLYETGEYQSIVFKIIRLDALQADTSHSEPTPMSVAAVVPEQPPLPVLVRNPSNPVLRIRIDVDGNSEPPRTVDSLTINTLGTTDLGELDKVELFYTGTTPITRAWENADGFAEATRFGKASIPQKTITFKGAQDLQTGPNYFWLSYTLRSNADIDHVVDAGCDRVTLTDGTIVVPQVTNPGGAQRLGVAVRQSRDDGVHTYRIPGLATTNNGTLIGVYDIRRRGAGDLPGDIDIGMSRSTDGGQTWEPMQVIMDMGSDPEWKYDGIGDPSVLVDRQTNTIWVAAVWSHGNRGWFGSQPGMRPEDTGQLMLVRSADDGKTWSKPINITAQIKRPEWCFLLQGPGKGITMQDGTLVFPAQFQDTAANNRLPRSTIIFSRDRGETWNIGTGAFDDTTEAQVVELELGVLMLNCRYNREGRRVVMTTRDMGSTWHEHPSSRRALIEPRACMASLINVDRQRGRTSVSRLLFSNPNSSRGRRRITIKASDDQGETWPESQQLLLDSGACAGYSCMSMVDDETVGILYEGSQAHLTFQRIKLSELREDRIVPR